MLHTCKVRHNGFYLVVTPEKMLPSFKDIFRYLRRKHPVLKKKSKAYFKMRLHIANC